MGQPQASFAAAIIGIVALATHAACGAAAERPARETRIVSCEDGHVSDTPNGRLVNNMWNKQAAVGAYEQCLLMRGEPAAPLFGWSWEWPIESETLLAYPQALFGWKPWNGGVTTNSALPIQISSIETLELSYRVHTTAQGKYNFAATMWITRSGRTSDQPNPADISADVNVWMNNRGVPLSGEQVATARIANIDVQVWHAADIGDASGANSNRWQHVVYLAQAVPASGTLDLAAFVRDAVDRGILSPAHYVSSVELGNEIVSGSGETWIEALTLKVH